ncbi:MAG: 4Fe-4S dicluster domain-containing protein [Beijerinckiaceae bacterium]|nr:MAG: 4Fe-4S dicluster domain-containing protein [Beijerinckiaceae bacterium]
MPVRDTFGLVPPGSELALDLFFVPFAMLFAFGMWRRMRGFGLWRAIVNSPGGIRSAIGRLGSNALLQHRVALRPRGWPHLAIFFGFLVLLSATTIVAIDWDIARPLGFRVLAGARYLYFEVFVEALALAFVIGLLAALAWRLVRLRRVARDQRRIQYQFLILIGGLLYMGLTGFLLESLRLTIRPVPWADWSFIGVRLASALSLIGIEHIAKSFYVVLWWSHAFVAFSLIASLPYTAFLHAAAAPLNSMTQPGIPQRELNAPFDLRTLMDAGDFDVKVGAASVADLDAGQRFALQACTNCGRCDEVCPATAMGTALSPRWLVQKLRAKMLSGSATQDLLATDILAPAELWACTTCAACVQACPVFIRPVDYIIPFRRELVARQRLDKRQTEFLANLSLSGNAYGLPAERRNQLAAELRSAARSSEE